MQSQFSLEEKGGVVSLTPNGGHKETLIWLHGLGDSPAGFLDIFSDLRYSPLSPTTKIVLPTAPIRKVTINMGFESTSWFDIRSFSISEKDFHQAISIKEVEESSQIINQLIEKEIKVLGDSKKVFIGGFSQGACMSLHCGLQYKERLGGIIALSGFLFPITKFEEPNADTPIFIAHGMKDFVINFDLSQKSYERLIALKSQRKHWDLHIEKAGGHDVPMTTLLRIKQFFQSCH